MTLFPFLDTRHQHPSGSAVEDTRGNSECQPPLFAKSHISLNATPPAPPTPTTQEKQRKATDIACATLNNLQYHPQFGGDAPASSRMTRTMSSSSDCSNHSHTSTCSSKRRTIFPHYNGSASFALENSDSRFLLVSPQVNKKKLGGEASSSMESFSSASTRQEQECSVDVSLPPVPSALQPPAHFSPSSGPQGQHLTLPPLSPHQKTTIQSASGTASLPSILRSPSRFVKKAGDTPETSPRSVKIVVDKIPSVESDIPSLASTASQSSMEDPAAVQQHATKNAIAAAAAHKPARTRSLSAPLTNTERKKISFDPRVWVREFTRESDEEDVTWYSSKDMEAFKREAIQLILACSETELVPTGTGRFVPRKVMPQTKAFYSHRALRMDTDEDVVQSEQIAEVIASRVTLKEREIKRILIVDPHDICIKLFAKGFKNILPHVETIGVSSSEEALSRCKSLSFDIILVEERLKLFHQQQASKCPISSGSALIREMKPKSKETLFVGVSTRLREDAPKLKAGGADLCWPKPPPKMDGSLSDSLLQMILERRGRAALYRAHST
eukprot:CAMPEP_0172447872 /NCGR_PEP_ID=MMETSP1065-20121228/7042_1 /TAXON_ID=265537 /ORGANISM="Amphiprora paludosa, Strain CCMP125" /LENGTH=556 /DNA_ID=CAMNT_0013199243 /DNA_START=334 /DNA_END=2004 /DNA_ORIENTATION=+